MGQRPAYPVEIGQGDLNPFFFGYIYAHNSRHFIILLSCSLTLSLFMLGVRADDPDNAPTLNNFAPVANSSYRRFYFHFDLKVILPRLKSYGESSNFTLSPGSIRIKCMRILPETWASTRWPFSNSTLNIALGSASVT